MKKCPNCSAELKDTARFCMACGMKLNVEPSAGQDSEQKIPCPKCGNLLKLTAKFCIACGTRLNAAGAPSDSDTAPSSAPPKDFSLIGANIHWNILDGQLAVKIDENDIAAYGKVVKGISVQDGVKALFFLKGELISELNSGTYSFKELGGDEFRPKQPKEAAASSMEKKAEKKSIWGNIVGFFTRRANRERARAAGLTNRIPANIPPVSIILVRTADFPLVFDLKGINTANIRCDVGLHILCKITNINEFYYSLLLDRKMVCFEDMRQKLAPIFSREVDIALSGVPENQVNRNSRLQNQLLPSLQIAVSRIYPFISITSILDLTCTKAELEELRRLSEELYIAEQELNAAMRRNEFMVRLQAEKNEQELIRLQQENAHKNEMQDAMDAQTLHERNRENKQNNSLRDLNYANEVDNLRADASHAETVQDINQSYVANSTEKANAHTVQMARMESAKESDLEKIFEEMAVTADEKAKFLTLLNAQRQIREAKSEEEVNAALHEFEKSGLLRKQEIDNLRRQIAHGEKLNEMNDDQILALTTMQNQQTLDEKRIDWEILMGKRQLASKIELENMQYEHQADLRNREEDHDDSRREKDAQFSDKRREADFDFSTRERKTNIELERDEMQVQLDLLKQTQAIRAEKEDAEHKRRMEAEQAERNFRLDDKRLDLQAQQQRLDAENRNTSIYATMSFEQIMAANPNISPEAAQALAEKFKADTATAQNNEKLQMALDNKNEVKDILLQQQAMFQQMFMAQQQQQERIILGQQQQQQNVADMKYSFSQQMLDAKQQELERTRADASANSDRFVDGMKTTITAVGNMKSQQPVPPSSSGRQKAMSVCPECNEPIVAGASFCENCGHKL